MANNDALNTATTPIDATKGGTGLSSTVANQLLYSSAANTIAGLATANSSVIATSGSGVPSSSSALPTAVGATITPTGNGMMQYVRLALSNANLLAMFATPVSIIAAPGANKVILLYRAEIELVYSGVAFTGGGNITFQYGSGGVSAGCTLSTTSLTATQTQLAAVAPSAANTVSQANCVNKAIYVSNATGAFLVGTGTANVNLWYSIINTTI